MPIYRGTTPLKPYRGDMQPVNIYRGVTKLAGWHDATASGQSPLSVDCDYNVPPDALTIDGKCVQTVGVWGTNLISNGDFSNGTTGWEAYLSTISESSGRLAFTATGQYGKARAITAPTIIGHSYYARVKATIPTAYVYYFGMSNHESYIQVTGETSFSLVRVATAATTRVDFGDNRASGWQTAYLDNVCLIDLTAAFGAGNEPTAAQMDAYLAAYPNSWFDGSALITTDGTPNSPGPTYPAPITTITGDLTITGANGALSDTATASLGSVELCSLPDGTKDEYDAVTGIVTKRVGKAVFDGSVDEVWKNESAPTRAGVPCYVFLINNSGIPVQTALTAISDRFPVQTDAVPATLKPNGVYALYLAIEQSRLTAGTVAALRAWLADNPVTVYYKLATPYTIQLTPDLPVVRTGIKTLSIGADVAPNLTATVKAIISG